MPLVLMALSLLRNRILKNVRFKLTLNDSGTGNLILKSTWERKKTRQKELK